MESTSGTSAGLVDLPAGGGALRSLGERFQPDLVRGSGSYAIPLQLPRGAADSGPQLTLCYSTGQGNGPFGVGWNLAGPMVISRRTDRGVPTYTDRDELVVAGAEVLVPCGDGRYRPRVDTQGWRLRREPAGWELRTKDGTRMRLGSTVETRVEGPGGPFSWLVESVVGAAGDEVRYRWEVHGGHAYLAEVTWSTFALRLVYEDRADVLTTGRAGFEQVVSRRCCRIERHTTTEAASLTARYLLTYEQAAHTEASLLVAVQLQGIAADGTTEAYPPVRLGYSALGLLPGSVQRIRTAVSSPPSIDRPDVALVDMDGDGLPDILETGPSASRYWPNRGGELGPPRPLPHRPAGMVLGQRGVSFADLTGDGTVDLFRSDARLATAVLNTGRGGWGRPVVFDRQPQLALSGSSTRLVDLDGDGVLDLLATGRHRHVASYHRRGRGWSDPVAAVAPGPPEEFPDLDLAADGVELVDLNGDGLTDLAYVAPGRVEYWPSLGHDRWGPRVRMANPPHFPAPFDRRRLHLVDLDGDGAADLLYLGLDRACAWFNRSGRSWSERVDLAWIPARDARAVTVVDLCGDGTPGLLWTAPSTGQHDAGLRFLRLTAPTKPHLLTSVDDGFGAVTTIRYTTSTAERRRDEDAGQPWRTFLPFPVHVVSEIEHHDRPSGRVVRTRFRYHRGRYDGTERELRGFEVVEQLAEGDDAVPSVERVLRFHQGEDPGGAPLPPIEAARQRALAGSLVRVETFEFDDAGQRTLRRVEETAWEARLEASVDGRHVHFPHAVSTSAREISATGKGRTETASYRYDDHGNLVGRSSVAQMDDQTEPPAVLEQMVTYVQDEERWLVGLPSSIETRAPDGTLLKQELRYYDGPAFVGLPLGDATRGLLRRTRELVLDEALLPDGYVEAIEPGWHLHRDGGRWYRDAFAHDHDAAGNVTAVRDAFGRTTYVEFDAHGLFPVRRVDPLGLETRCAFDPRTAQPVELVQSDGRVTRLAVSPLGRVRGQYETVSDGSVALVQVYAASVDPQGQRPPRVVSVRPLEAGRDLAELHDGLDPAAVVDASVAVDHYDADGNLLERVVRVDDDPSGSPRWVARERRTYTVHGRSRTELANELRATPEFVPPAPTSTGIRFRYDGLDQATQVERPDGTRLSIRYLGDRLEKRDAATADGGAPTVEWYDGRGQLVAVDQPTGETTARTRYDRDLLGRITAIHDASGRLLLEYGYAGPGPAVQVRHADAGTRTYWRDARGSIRVRTDDLGRRMVNEYDEAGRATAIVDGTDVGNPVVVRRLDYDGSRVREVREGEVLTTYAYDPAGRTVRTDVTLGGETFTVKNEHTYDGQPMALTYPDGTRITYEQGRDSRTRSIPGLVDRVDYDVHNSPVAVHLTGGARNEYAYDPDLHRLVTARLVHGSSVVRDLAIDYDVNGNIHALHDRWPGGHLSRQFTYDPLYRLTRAKIRDHGSTTLVADHVYRYSPTGDILVNSESVDGLRYDDLAHAGRLTGYQEAGSAAWGAISYDAAGRTTAAGSMTRIEYDLFDRVIEVVLADGTRVRFTYDHRGERVRKQVRRPDDTTATTVSIGRLYERGPTGARLQVHLGKLLVAVRWATSGGQAETHYVLTDHLGSILAACTPAGDQRAQQLYSSFGRPLWGQTVHDRYLGLATDGELAITQFGARHYHPGIARFLTPDWFVAEDPSRALRTPQGLNAYAYAMNNPIALRDPSGLWFGIDDAIAAAVGFVVGFVAGVVHGIATGKSFGDTLLNGLEGGLLGAVGAWLAYNTLGLAAAAFSAGGILGTVGGVLLTAGAIGIFVNATMSGALQIYDWESGGGWLAFVADYSWGLVGTALGGLLIMGNGLYKDAGYRADLSRRQNRHVYDGGFGFETFAFTQGNVTSNFRNGSPDLLDHEGLHTFTSRLFGPLFQATYVAWFVGGAVLGAAIFGPIGAIGWGDNYGETILDIAYRDNPWEVWAYCAHTPGGSPGGRFAYNC